MISEPNEDSKSPHASETEIPTHAKSGLRRRTTPEEPAAPAANSQAASPPPADRDAWLGTGEREAHADRLRALGTLTGSIAHEFNNLLLVIASSAEWARDALTDTSRNEALDLLLDATDRGAQLTKQLLAFGRPASGQREKLAASDALDHVCLMLRRLLPQHIALDTQIDRGLGQLSCNRLELNQMLINLAVNARDAMPQGGRLRVNASADELDAQPAVRITLTDTGTGMSSEVADQAFTPFFSTKAPDEGAGLGLSVVRSIVKRMRGTIELRSSTGAGTRLIVVLPTIEASTPTSLAPDVAPGTRQETVLLVDDDPLVRVSIARVLRSAGYAVYEAESGLDALRVWGALSGNVDLIVTDALMPHLGAWELSPELAQKRLQVPLLVCTGHAEADVARATATGNLRAVLTKPFSGQELLRQVRSLLDQTRDGSTGKGSIRKP